MESPEKGSPAPTGPLVLYDGGCGFCRRSVATARGRWFRARIEAQPYQEADLVVHNLDVENCAKALHCVDTDGAISVGGQAVATILRHSRFPWPIVGRVMTWPGARWVADRLYFLVADNRHRLPGPKSGCDL